MKLQAVLFDMDGVQLDSEPAHTRSFERLFDGFGIPMPPGLDDAFRGRDDRDIFADLRERFHLPGTVEELIARRTRHFLEVLEREPVEAMDGLLPLFDELDRRSVPFALCSSSVAPIVDGILRRLGTRNRFQAIVTGSDVARCKPAPDLFLEGARRLRAEPARCVVIEDSASGILAGRTAGARTVLLHDASYREARSIDADLAVDSLRELRVDLLERLVGGGAGTAPNT